MPAACINILLVDDNDDDVLLMTEAFAACDRPCAVTSVQDGQAALDYLRQVRADPHTPTPDLVLLDINMPRLDGFGVLDAIRKAPDLATLPVVVVSTSKQAEDVDRAMALGAHDCVQKPVGFDQLKALASQVLQRWAGPAGGALKQA